MFVYVGGPKAGKREDRPLYYCALFIMRMRSIYHVPACEDLSTMSSDSIPFQEVFMRMRIDGLRRFIP